VKELIGLLLGEDPNADVLFQDNDNYYCYDPTHVAKAYVVEGEEIDENDERFKEGMEKCVLVMTNNR